MCLLSNGPLALPLEHATVGSAPVSRPKALDIAHHFFVRTEKRNNIVDLIPVGTEASRPAASIVLYKAPLQLSLTFD